MKGAFHATAAALLGIMAAYNAVAFCYRRERHLGANAALYALGAAFEVTQSARHFRKQPIPL